jgi:hypothetical protein
MSERHITDEEIRGSTGAAPRAPQGTPKAVCLACGVTYTSYYACFSHECLIDLAEQKPYSDWLLFFQLTMGYGVLRAPIDRKFRDWSTVISGRKMLTEWLQSDILAGPGYELQPDHYRSQVWQDAGFPYQLEEVEPGGH